MIEMAHGPKRQNTTQRQSRQYHLRFGPQLLQIAEQAEDMGALDGAVQPLRDKQVNLREIRQLAGYLKSGIATNYQL
jgi:hypothetical protein